MKMSRRAKRMHRNHKRNANKNGLNLTALMDSIIRARPSGVKGQFILAAYLTTTMGPSIKLDVPGMLTMAN